MNRRQFLGAAAALSALPLTTEPADAGRDHEAMQFDAGEIATASGMRVASTENVTTKVHVSSGPSGVELTLRNDLGEMRALLVPEDVAALRAALAEANTDFDPEMVAYSRDFIAEKHR